jgi:hypothetical protein
VEDNVKLYLREIGWGQGSMYEQDLSGFCSDRWWALVYTVMKLQMPQNVQKFLSV